jgi:transketolase
MTTEIQIPMRIAYGEELVKLGQEYQDIVVLDADLALGTQTYRFKDVFPERFFDVGLAEQNEMSIAAGLASTGKVPFASTFCVFASMRALDQIRNMIAYPKLNVKIAATNAGISIGEDGATHQSVEDLAIMRSIPNMTVISPADAREVKILVRLAYHRPGPVYLRIGRIPWPVIDNDSRTYEIGKGVVLREGQDISIFATGHLVWEALQAAETLQRDEIEASVVNIHTIKPLDTALIIRMAQHTQAVVTAEEHSIIGGLGSAVAEVLVENAPVPMERIGLHDTFGESGNGLSLMRKYHLVAEDIVRAAKNVMKRKLA